ncbi:MULTISPECIES: hypothetical protein [Psychrobacter]|jgi:hypothetical protein|uniref:hypothetical protein n=1 Tax=Psychrobacter TaxID=497 RepID=UPI001917C7DE|nr:MULTISPECIES: hypothetical protein [Psychrobacter]MDA5134096.1 hypothetical protein [Psychrobacter sp. ANT_H3]
MSDDPVFSTYELGIIQNSLRKRMAMIEEFRTDVVTPDLERAIEMSQQIEVFKQEVQHIQDKIRSMIEKRVE